MILVRSPLRISFIGSGTDLPAVYGTHGGNMLSVTINKFVYVLINPTPLVDRFTIKYQKVEKVNHPSELEHTRIKMALLDLGITSSGLEIGSFADLPVKTGLGSSSSFSVALLKGLYSHLGKNVTKDEIAQAACRLEIDLVKESFGKHDQYAAAFGGFNIYHFHPDDTVTVEPLLLDYKKTITLQQHLLLFFIDPAKNASFCLNEQSVLASDHPETYRAMVQSVREFKDRLYTGDIHGLALMLHEAWLDARTCSLIPSNEYIDSFYTIGREAGAWGGSVLGGTDSGCLLLIAPPEQHGTIRALLSAHAQEKGYDVKEIPIGFVVSGTDILFKHF